MDRLDIGESGVGMEHGNDGTLIEVSFNGSRGDEEDRNVNVIWADFRRFRDLMSPVIWFAFPMVAWVSRC